MNSTNLTVKISFESLVDAISTLNIEDKQKLWQIIDNQLNISENEDEPYDWGENGQPETKPVEYVMGKGVIVIERNKTKMIINKGILPAT
ncbi:hypothetical protein [Aphanothece sacrum]|uniref:Glycosyl transferase n=1 Tax=Aphanothece sacrum FPU1 TaxID=1920663 RepID=A0A401IMY5_APHSA|nr:hypothetical protein [Aphanothece sacrum]GBF82605.1 glycosyl transferase [Aphanothece sacrum FPU1]GBF84739.1 glycosyl transferase [Aphanothece sacrum FPU3]